jgi:beta-glucanase (GH16 family)
MMSSRAHRALCVLAIGALLACSSGGSTTPTGNTTPTPQPTTTWTQVWSDEFDGAAGTLVDPTKWNYDLADGCTAGNCGWGNNEKEYYTNSPDNVSLNGQGQLAIVARAAPAGLTCYYGPCKYTSAKITTRGKMGAAPGRVEARIKLSSGQGLWPAFWMLGTGFPGVKWPESGELDIMENKGSQASTSSSAIHGPGYSGNTPFAHVNVVTPGTLSSDYHTYAVEWDKEHAQFYVDGFAHYNVTRGEIQNFGPSILDQGYFVILNLAVGGNFDGDPKSDSIFPATMLVDYVRVFKATTN